MSQDFAKKRRSPSAKKTNNTGSSKRKPSPRRSKKTPPKSSSGWIWLLTGFLLGSLGSFLLFLSGIIPAPSAQKDTVAVDKRVTAKEPKKEIPQPRFDFYELLKESEVVVEKSPDEYNGGGTRTQKNMEYLLQVGSFRNGKDADSLHAKLAFSGFDSQVEKVKVRNGSIWHRVLVGPYSSKSKLANTRGKLIGQGIETLVIEREAKK